MKMANTAQSAQSKTGTTEQLVQFLVDTDYSHLSEAARERAKELVLDFARAALGGGTSPLGKIVLDRIKGVGARAEASVIGGKFRTTTAAASSRGWVLPFNHVGAVSSACKILDLDVDTARAALGIALGNAGGVNPQENFSHYLQLGVPAFSAVQAAEYAANGVTANSSMLEAPPGLCDQFPGPGGPDFG